MNDAFPYTSRVATKSSKPSAFQLNPVKKQADTKTVDDGISFPENTETCYPKPSREKQPLGDMFLAPENVSKINQLL